MPEGSEKQITKTAISELQKEAENGDNANEQVITKYLKTTCNDGSRYCGSGN